ncbi:uncharacterized protein HKW66_Vig0099990 [Vigna angularis]|uniref:Uncharacterized protein n=1 Tax=Phaseolus angularis TaxID=3914 RepID=A0A8T0KJK4_PHAAN|nr:uncharacterized protein HKW66_Vig0099990 [Vigna angularis]
MVENIYVRKKGNLPLPLRLLRWFLLIVKSKQTWREKTPLKKVKVRIRILAFNPKADIENLEELLQEDNFLLEYGVSSYSDKEAVRPLLGTTSSSLLHSIGYFSLAFVRTILIISRYEPVLFGHFGEKFKLAIVIIRYFFNKNGFNSWLKPAIFRRFKRTKTIEAISNLKSID